MSALYSLIEGRKWKVYREIKEMIICSLGYLAYPKFRLSNFQIAKMESMETRNIPLGMSYYMWDFNYFKSIASGSVEVAFLFSIIQIIAAGIQKLLNKY